MRSFVVLIIEKNLTRPQLELALGAFAQLVKELTPRHRKNLRLRIVANQESRGHLTRQLQQLKLTKYAELPFPATNDLALQEASVLVHPNSKSDDLIFQQALAQSVPVLTYVSPAAEAYLDASCAILLPLRSADLESKQWSSALKNLYFDPEAQRFMAQNALRLSQRKPLQVGDKSLTLAS